MSKWHTPIGKNGANLIVVRSLSMSDLINVTPIASCGNCGKPAVVQVSGSYLRCQPCANHLVNLWNEVRSNLDGQDG